jgi:hypothetical protein
MVNFQPSIARVRTIAVTVVAGVAIRKAMVAALEEPCLYSVIAVGRTPQEQRGNGMPTSVAVRIAFIFPPPIYRRMTSEGTKTFSRPAKRNPSNSHGAASPRKCQKLAIISVIISIPSHHF